MAGPGTQTSDPIREDRGFATAQAPQGSERAPDPGPPPRLCPEDLRDPGAYHRRLLAWLSLQT